MSISRAAVDGCLVSVVIVGPELGQAAEVEDDEEYGGKNITYVRLLGGRSETDDELRSSVRLTCGDT
jgi:hypothetical protein